MAGRLHGGYRVERGFRASTRSDNPKPDVPPMISDTTWIRQELPDVARLFEDECRTESECRGRPVNEHDPVVRTRVADRLLNGAGERIRRRMIRRGVFPETE